MSAHSQNTAQISKAKSNPPQPLKPENPGLQPYARRPASVMAVLWDGSPKSKAAVIELAMTAGRGVTFEDSGQLTAVVTRRWLELGEPRTHTSRYQTGVWLVRDRESGLLFKVSRAEFERDYEARNG